MDQRVLDEDEEELYGIRRKKTPEGELTAELDDEYVYEGYPDLPEGLDEDFNYADKDDESLVMLSSEEAKKVLKERQEEEAKREEKFRGAMERGNEALLRGDYEEAKVAFEEANGIHPEDLELNVGYMRAYAKDFASLENFEEIDRVYGQCYDSADEPFAKRIKEEFGERLEELRKGVEKELGEKKPRYEASRDARASEIGARLKRASGNTVKTTAPLVATAVLTAVFAFLITTVVEDTYLILTAIFGGITAVLLVPSLVFARKTLNIYREAKKNADIYSTDEGAEVARLQDKLDFLSECLE